MRHIMSIPMYEKSFFKKNKEYIHLKVPKRCNSELDKKFIIDSTVLFLEQKLNTK